MEENIVAKLTAKDDKYACALADKIISESQETDEWYEYFDDFASLLDHPKSLVRNRVLHILAANAQWDEENHFDSIISDLENESISIEEIISKYVLPIEKQIATERTLRKVKNKVQSLNILSRGIRNE